MYNLFYERVIPLFIIVKHQLKLNLVLIIKNLLTHFEQDKIT